MGWHLRVFSGRRRLRRVTAVAAVPTLALAMLALPSAIPAAQASAVPSGCIDNYEHFCTWQNSNYSGTKWVYPEFGTEQSNGYWWYVGSSQNDQISSLYNYSLSYAYIAKNCPADSQWTWIGVGQGAPNLANNKWPDGTGMNDSISAWSIGPQGEASPSFPAHGNRTIGGC